MSLGLSMVEKRVALSDLVSRIPDGSSIAFGGSFLHRGPFALVRELIRQGKRDLEIIKQSPGYDIDLLCRAGAVRKVRAGIVAMEGNFGLAPWYRRAIESGEVQLEEHSCASLTAGLRASAFGVPFLPCGGLHGSDIPALNGWQALEDPYGSGAKVWVVPPIKPDYAVIHVNETDSLGNGRVFGTSHWDRILTRASDKVLLTAERMVDTDSFRGQPELTLVPSFMVEAMSVVPRGAWPGSCSPHYEIEYSEVERYLDDGPRALKEHLTSAPEAAEVAHV